MAKKKFVTVEGRIVKMVTDRSRYKNYAPEVEFDGLFVSFKVPQSEAVVKDDGVHITLEGFTMHILDEFASHLDDMHREWEKRKAAEEQEAMQERMKKNL